MTITYIVFTKSNEYYCGKTDDLHKRLKEHLKEKKPHWFAFKGRKKAYAIIYFNGDHEKQIKAFGIKRFYKLIKSAKIFEKRIVTDVIHSPLIS